MAWMLVGGGCVRDLEPVLITRTDIQKMLGGISRTTFYRMRQRWQLEGTPFPEPVDDFMPPKGGALYRYAEVMAFFKARGYL
ncbi:helix-turn-helix transcriptional regulator [Citrobacter freundii]|uniref:helix-turn-helix transcriptional regulator n=1 Tax=Citrobacter freundii TaxID=546 RepID=UPI003B22D36F